MHAAVIEASSVVNAIGLALVPTLWRYPSIFCHELGHALVARAVGLRVRRIAVGEGEVLWRKKIAGVETLLGLVPFSGMVDIDWAACGRFRFCLIIAAGPAANLLLAVLAIWLLWPTDLGALLFALVLFELVTVAINLFPRYVSIDGVNHPSDGMLIMSAFRKREKG